MCPRALCILVFAYLLSTPASAQQVSFTAPDSVCVNSPVSVSNVFPGATTYNWNFCVSNIDTTPTAIDLGNVGGMLSSPVWMSVVQDGGNYYAFVIDHLSGNLICLSFGSSLLNTPTSQNLGTCGVIPQEAEGIQVIHAGGMWTAIIVGGNTTLYPSKIVKVDLGASLAAMTPVGTDWGNIGGLYFPVKLYIFQDASGDYHGFTDNFTGNTLTEFDFGTSFVNPPTGINLGNIGGLNGPTGIFPIQDAGNWYLFITNEISNTLTRLDFGSSLLNTPTPVNLGNPGNTLNGPRDFYLMKFCGKTVGYALNQNSNDLVKLDFNAGVTDPAPTAVSLGNLNGDFNFPHSFANFFQAGSNIYTFVCNVNSNAMTELVFEGCNNISIPNSTLPTPPPFSYSVPGVYNISLMTDLGLPTQSTYCQSIVVLPPPTITLPADTSVCVGEPGTLMAPSYPGATYTWSTGSDSNSAVMDTAGKYWVDLNDYGCTLSDTVKVKAIPVPTLNLPADTTLCDSGILRYATTQPVTFVWNTASITDSTKADTSGSYWLQLNEGGCTAIDTIKVTIVSTHQIHLGDDTTYCGPGILSFVDTALVTYQWNTGSDSSSTPVTSTGSYNLAVNDQGCISRDTVQITVVPIPAVYLPQDTFFCDSGMLSYVSPLPVTYVWSTGSDSSSTLVRQSGLVRLTVSTQGCSVKDSTLCTVPVTPPLYLPKDTIFCGPGVLGFVSALPVTYTWNTGAVTDTIGVTGDGSYWLALDNQGCISRDTTLATVKVATIVNLGDDTAVCLNEAPFVLTAGNPVGYTYKWQDNSAASTYPVTTPGLYYVKVTGTDGCSAADTILITARPAPYFTLGGVQPICPGEVIVLNPGVDSLTYTWQNGSADTILDVTEPGTYFVTGSNVCGSYQDSVTIYRGICVVHVPSAFTPNGDGANDVLRVLGVEVVDQFDFCIYNRWGQKVFETGDKSQGWDGASQPVGAYVYTLRFRYEITKQVYTMSGTVTLIR